MDSSNCFVYCVVKSRILEPLIDMYVSVCLLFALKTRSGIGSTDLTWYMRVSRRPAGAALVASSSGRLGYVGADLVVNCAHIT